MLGGWVDVTATSTFTIYQSHQNIITARPSLGIQNNASVLEALDKLTTIRRYPIPLALLPSGHDIEVFNQ